MANAVIIFDVEPKAETATVITAMAALGYFNHWTSNNVRYALPSNTIWKPNTEFLAAVNDLTNIIAGLNSIRAIGRIILTNYLVLNSTPWTAMPIPAQNTQ